MLGDMGIKEVPPELTRKLVEWLGLEKKCSLEDFETNELPEGMMDELFAMADKEMLDKFVKGERGHGTPATLLADPEDAARWRCPVIDTSEIETSEPS
jgi:hypothetical protein